MIESRKEKLLIFSNYKNILTTTCIKVEDSVAESIQLLIQSDPGRCGGERCYHGVGVRDDPDVVLLFDVCDEYHLLGQNSDVLNLVRRVEYDIRESDGVRDKLVLGEVVPLTKLKKNDKK